MRPATVLLVDDDERDVELILRALHHVGVHEVAVARDGVEALERLHGDEPLPRVVLLDLKLPRVDGLEVLRRLKGEPRTRGLPVVALTSSREERDLLASYELGANGYIVKPLSFDRFNWVIGQVGVYWLHVNQPPPEGSS